MSRRGLPAGLTPAERKRALANARQARWRGKQKKRAIAVVGLAEGATNIDVATLLHDRLAERLADEELDLLDRDVQGAMRIALTSAAIKDKRKDRGDTKNAVLNAWALIQITTGLPIPREALPDGMTIEGDAVEIEPEEDALAREEMSQ